MRAIINFRLAMVYLLVTMLFSVRLQATTYFVTELGAGVMDGSSWVDAATGADLQMIIDNTISGDTVWVACGTYKPTTGTDRSISFSMQEGVEIYGSFQGTEMTLDERNLSCGPCSILSGEIGLAGNTDNSYTVVSNSLLNSTAVLDGFTLRDGNDDRSPTSFGNGLGGGLYNHGRGSSGFCHPIIRNCLFTNNYASWGAGAFNNGTNDGNTEPTYTNCVFYQNHAYEEAGGMDSYAVGGHAAPTLNNILFYENTSDSNVGAMYAWGGSNGSCHPVLTNCVFVNNSALNGYGGAFIADNQNEGGGGSSGSCSVTLKNCIVWNNTATGTGPQFYVRGNGAEVLATYSDIDMTDQNAPHIISGAGTGNIDITPLFHDIADGDGLDDCWFSDDDGLKLQNTSPCINLGDNSNTPSTDLLGYSRIVEGFVDLGAYELQALLPVELIFFSAQKVDQGVRLEWQTAQEVNNDFFRIERSLNGIDFISIGEKDGSNLRNEIADYYFIDQNVIGGFNYYRLRQYDLDGESNISNVVSVELSTDEEVSIYPNPVSDQLFISSGSAEDIISLMDAMGRPIAGVMKNRDNTLTIEMSNFTSGMYLLKVNNKAYKIYKE